MRGPMPTSGAAAISGAIATRGRTPISGAEATCGATDSPRRRPSTNGSTSSEESSQLHIGGRAEYMEAQLALTAIELYLINKEQEESVSQPAPKDDIPFQEGEIDARMVP